MCVVDQHIDGMALCDLVKSFGQLVQIVHIHVVAMHAARTILLIPELLLLAELSRTANGYQVCSIFEQGLGKGSSEKS